MLKIRLQRVGRKHDPSFRVVLTDSKKGPKSAYLEMLGSYDARTNKPVIKADRVKHWMSNGAQASHTVHNLLVGEKIIDGKKVDVSSKKNVGKKEAEAKEKDEAEAKAKEEAKEAEESKEEEVSPEGSEEKADKEDKVEEEPAKSEAPEEVKEA